VRDELRRRAADVEHERLADAQADAATRDGAEALRRGERRR